MTLYEIKHKYTGSVLFSLETNSLQLAVEAGVKAKADLRGADLRGANLRGADLRGANFWEADLRGADLRRANLREAYLRDADVMGANLRAADLREADLWGANFMGANLRIADLRGADLMREDLWDANLRRADLRGVNLKGADLRGADLKGAYLRDEITIDRNPIQISGAYWDIIIWDEHMQIGCEFYSLNDWFNFNDARINRMDQGALTFWQQWKESLMQICIADERYQLEEASEGE